MYRVTAASLALLIALAPAGVAAAADARPAAAGVARPLTQVEAKRLTERMTILSGKIDDLRQQASRASRAAYRSNIRREPPAEVTASQAKAYGAPLRYTVIPSDYLSVVITDTNGLAGYKAAPPPTGAMKNQRLVRLEQEIATLTRERDLISARLAAHRAGA